MGRVATERVVLSNGTIVPRGQSILVDSSNMWSREVHPTSPEIWDGFRFYKMRKEKGKEDIAPLVTTSAAHIAFGYGTYSCPGRFFAAAQIKIALINILTRYDIELADGLVPASTDMGFTCVFNPSFQIRVRCRRDKSQM
jgi:cytochrome P450